MSIQLKRQKIVLLTKARQYIKNNHCRGVCRAIQYADDYSDSKAANQLKDYINRVLGYRNAYLETWLRDMRPKYLWPDMFDGGYAKEARLQWVDWMIARLQEDIAAGDTTKESKLSCNRRPRG